MPADPTPDALVANLTTIREQIAGACGRAGRDPGEVRIVAAAKTFEPEAIERVRDAGVREVGENYVKELADKRDRVDGNVWHFIGNLQCHSAHHVAELADVVETVSPGRAAERLARRALDIGRSIPVLIEVDFTGERTGVAGRGGRVRGGRGRRDRRRGSRRPDDPAADAVRRRGRPSVFPPPA